MLTAVVQVITPVFILADIPPKRSIDGPAIIIQNVATVVVEPGCCAYITADSDIEIDVHDAAARVVGTHLDPIYLSIFSHRFMGIAEQMGRYSAR
jgi:5-oxoprolinase (ATP-hydrolysing)